MARDFINMPACDMTPARLAHEAIELARRNGARRRGSGRGAAAADFPAIHAVGQASSCAPRLVDFGWGDPAHPKVTIVGKGVCFDSGGLDIKPSAGMLLMKKDMGGAACALALARLVMESQLPVRLRVLIPAVENAIAGNAYRPGDVIRTRKGLTVEVGNTDAEGRLVLCDAIAAADDEQPDLMIDLATLTGAARVALGPDLPAVFGSRQQTVDALLRRVRRVADPLWQMPLWAGYEDDIASKVADLNNASASAFAGAIIGALFLRRFVTQTQRLAARRLVRLESEGSAGPPGGCRGRMPCARCIALLTERYGSLRPDRARMDLSFERRAWTLIYLCLGLVEGGTAAVMVRALFGDQAPAMAVDLVLAVVSSAPAWANLASLAYARRAQGQPKIAFLVPLLVAMCCCVAALALVPRSGAGLILFFVLYASARLLWAGIETVRSVLWSVNYPTRACARGSPAASRSTRRSRWHWSGLALGWLLGQEARGGGSRSSPAASCGLAGHDGVPALPRAPRGTTCCTPSAQRLLEGATFGLGGMRALLARDARFVNTSWRCQCSARATWR